MVYMKSNTTPEQFLQFVVEEVIAWSGVFSLAASELTQALEGTQYEQ